MRENTALPGISCLVNTAVDALHPFLEWEDGVELGFLSVWFAAVDGLQGCAGVEGEAVWSIAEDRS